MNRWAQLAVAVGSLALIAGGCWWIYPPSALLAVGILLWADLYVRSPK